MSSMLASYSRRKSKRPGSSRCHPMANSKFPTRRASTRRRTECRVRCPALPGKSEPNSGTSYQEHPPEYPGRTLAEGAPGTASRREAPSDHSKPQSFDSNSMSLPKVSFTDVPKVCRRGSDAIWSVTQAGRKHFNTFYTKIKAKIQEYDPP